MDAARAPRGEKPLTEFTDFELKSLVSIARLFGAEESLFLLQLAAAEVVERENTIVGFYTTTRIDTSRCSPVNFDFQQMCFKATEVENDVGVLLWAEDGYLTIIEGWTVDADSFKFLALEDLIFVGPSDGIGTPASNTSLTEM